MEKLLSVENLPTKQEQVMLLAGYDFAGNFLSRAKQEGNFMGAHLLDHAVRVIACAALIAEGERLRKFPILMAALLIDLGRNVANPDAKTYKHGKISRELVEPFVKALPIDGDDQVNILNAIEDHPKLDIYVRHSFVVDVVMDSDKLATLGSLGPMRAAATRPNLPLVAVGETSLLSGDDQIKTVLQDIKERQGQWFNMLWTPTAKKMVVSRKIFHDSYIKEVLADVAPMYQAASELGLPLSLE